MTEVLDQARASRERRDTADQSVSSTTRTALDQFDRARAWGGHRQYISLSAAVVLAVGASVGTRLYLRRRALARIRRLARFALAARSLRAAMPPARVTAPIGGMSGAVLLATLLVARARHARKPSELEQVSGRLASLEAEAAARLPSDRLRPRDVLLGAALGLGLAGLVARVGPRHPS